MTAAATGTAPAPATVRPSVDRPAGRLLRAGAPRERRVPWLALVAVAYAAVQLLVVRHLGLGWDETVYVSQLDPRHPAAFFSAPRSRGISYLVAPIVAVTGSTTALRVALALLSAAALYAAYRVWRPLAGRSVPALAALLFGGLWVTELYGPQAMPNLWVALAGVAAAGWFLRTGGADVPRRAYVLLAACVAAATLFRFSDGAWLAAPLLAACVLGRAWRRPAPALAVLAGLALGSAQWAAEAYARWGGLGERLRVSSATEGDMGLHWNGGNAWHSLNGPLLCRPCTVGLTHPSLTLWWLALPVLGGIACALAAATRRPAVTLLPVACAALLSVPYLLLIDYAAPRFLLPAYALLALPIAGLAARTARVCHAGPPRATALVVLAVLLGTHLVGQLVVLRHETAIADATTKRYAAAAKRLNALGVRTPCLVAGEHAPPIGFYAGCASANVSGNNRNTAPAAVRHTAARVRTAALAQKGRTPFYARGWEGHRVPGTGLIAFVPRS